MCGLHDFESVRLRDEKAAQTSNDHEVHDDDYDDDADGAVCIQFSSGEG